jgi:SAM-dependent methyltransferase
MSPLARKTAAPPPGASAASAFAETYERLAGMEGDFTPHQVEAMELAAHHSVLDVGAGSGRLSLPVARRVRQVTALDHAQPLLDRLNASAEAEGITNITTRTAQWDDIEPGRDLPRHDVVIASRFTGTHDLMKLDAAANELVYVLLFAGPSTRALHRALLEGIALHEDDPPVAKPGVVSLFNEVSAFGIEPNAIHVPDGLSRLYPDESSALADFSWLGVDPDFQPLLNRNIRRFLRPEKHGVRFLFETRSALVWWRK